MYHAIRLCHSRGVCAFVRSRWLWPHSFDTWHFECGKPLEKFIIHSMTYSRLVLLFVQSGHGSVKSKINSNENEKSEIWWILRWTHWNYFQQFRIKKVKNDENEFLFGKNGKMSQKWWKHEKIYFFVSGDICENAFYLPKFTIFDDIAVRFTFYFCWFLTESQINL